ncbi:MAG: recombination regulator RecX [Eubacterium sp.]|jgi:regulatory protein|nr:recombination regulator RecX [Eubacterium sp.]
MPLKDDELSKARKQAMYLLGLKAYSEYDLKLKLLKNYNEEICEEVISKMKEYDFIDDHKYAKNVCSHLLRDKKYGEKLILFELKKHGIAYETCKNALSNYNKDDYLIAIKDLINKKYKKFALDEGERRRAVNALVRRGHYYGLILEVIKDFEE